MAEFNINSTVRVRLTDHGRRLLRIEHEKFWANTARPDYPYTPPKEDEGGWSEWQLWCLMRELGPHIDFGGLLPFETVIELGGKS